MIRGPRILDLFCGAGGASTGYHQAGFDVVGVDLNRQDHYPFEFTQDDALEYVKRNASCYDAIHASPPCQRYSSMTKRHGRSDTHPDLVGPVRELLQATGLPYVIENVQGAPLVDPVVLCGSMFWNAFGVRRHRLFETGNGFTLPQPECLHRVQRRVVGVYGNPGGSSKRDGPSGFGPVSEWRRLMGIDWMTAKGLAQAIPPAYTKWIGTHLLDHLGVAV